MSSGGPGEAVPLLSEEEFSKRKKSAINQILSDEVLDEETRAELFNKATAIGGTGNLSTQNAASANELNKILKEAQVAREGGTAVSQQRLKTKALRSILADQPGRSQTVLTR